MTHYTYNKKSITNKIFSTLLITFLILTIQSGFSQTNIVIFKGQVIDQFNNPISQASIKVGNGPLVQAKKNGKFNIPIPNNYQYKDIVVDISKVNYSSFYNRVFISIDSIYSFKLYKNILAFVKSQQDTITQLSNRLKRTQLENHFLKQEIVFDSTKNQKVILTTNGKKYGLKIEYRNKQIRFYL